MKKCNASSLLQKHLLAEKKQQLWQGGNVCILRSVMENLNCDSASIYTNTFSYTLPLFIVFIGQQSHAPGFWFLVQKVFKSLQSL